MALLVLRKMGGFSISKFWAPHLIENLRKLGEQKLAFLFQELISQKTKEAIEEEICQLSSDRKQCDTGLGP